MASAQLQNMEEEVPLKKNKSYWKTIFDKYDEDNNGRISFSELKRLVDEEKLNSSIISDSILRYIMSQSDEDNTEDLNFKEFYNMMHVRKFGYYINSYIATIIPNNDDNKIKYSCSPLPITMIMMSVVQTIIFLIDLVQQYRDNKEQSNISNALNYNPMKRYQVWRFLTYMLVHSGTVQLLLNLLIQILLGIPLEMVHKWWRVLIIYISGVLAGSLTTSIFDPNVYLDGASGGVYALLFAHVATIIMNWNEMDTAIWQIIVILFIILLDSGSAIYNRYFLEVDVKIGFAAHIVGGITGLLVGLSILRNLKVEDWEKKLQLISIVIFTLFVGTAIVLNLAWSSHFPQSR